jgi:hypothetical protein
MTVTPIRRNALTVEPVDFEALTRAQLRVILYAANYQCTYVDYIAADDGIGRMMRTITAVVGDLGLDLIREVGDLAAYAVLTRNDRMQAHLFPDTNQWNWTDTYAGSFLRAMAQNPPVVTVHTVAQRWHAALAGSPRAVEAVAS